MGYKIKIDDTFFACPSCGYRWTKFMGDSELIYDEKEHCLCCPNCGELIEDDDENEVK